MRILSMPALIGLMMMGALNTSTFGQADSVKSAPFRPGRFAAVAGTEATIGMVTLVGLNECWYKDYPRSSFHFFNDNDEWLQMDKFGHVFAAYQISHAGYSALRWSGVNEKKSAWFGGVTGFSFQLIIEMLDGFSKEWGFSLGDLAGNLGGSVLFTSQQLLWHEQKILLKYSCHLTPYAAYRPDLLGNTVPQRLLKDYNGETQWVSVSPGSFLKDKRKFPPWICFSAGIGANGMLGASNNGGSEHICPDNLRTRRIFLSMDLDLSKIPVKNKFLRTALSVINVVKMPFPTLEYQTTQKQFIGHWLYF